MVDADIFVTSVKGKVLCRGPLPPLPAIGEGIEVRHVEGMPGYAITDHGEVWSCCPKNGLGRFVQWRKLTPALDSKGYLFTYLWSGGNPHRFAIHALVALAFIGPREEGMHVCHGPAGKLDNRATNLRYGTAKENAADKFRDDTHNKGERHGNAKLTEKAIRRIFDYRKQGFTQKSIAEILGCAQSNVHRILSGKMWGHVGLAPMKDGQN